MDANIITIDKTKWDMLIHLRSRVKYYHKDKPKVSLKFKQIYQGMIDKLAA